jgi:DNA repair protein RadB
VKSVLKTIPTSCNFIDRLLEGGIPTGTVTLIYGEAETGKTTMTLQCVINCARMGYKTFFIDSDASFSSKRLLQMAPQDYEEIASQIILARPTNFKEQTHLINELDKYITEKFLLIIIDTITTLYRAELSEETQKTFALNRELNQQLALLTQIAKIKNVGVIVTSQVHSYFLGVGAVTEPVATRVLKFWPEIIIKLQPTLKPHLIQAVIEKHKKHSRSENCFLTIRDNGISDYQDNSHNTCSQYERRHSQ